MFQTKICKCLFALLMIGAYKNSEHSRWWTPRESVSIIEL